MDVSIVAVDAAGLRRLEAQLQPIYRECFAGPPYHESDEEIAGYPARLARQTGYPGAYGHVAEAGGRVVGAVYGWPAPATLPAGNAFDIAVRDAVPARVAQLLVAPAVVVAELMVGAAYRGRGIGRRLLARQVAGAPRAWLATHPDGDAVRLYERQGWVRQVSYQVGEMPLVLYTRQVTAGR